MIAFDLDLEDDWVGSNAEPGGTPFHGDPYYDGMDPYELMAQWGLEGKE